MNEFLGLLRRNCLLAGESEKSSPVLSARSQRETLSHSLEFMDKHVPKGNVEPAVIQASDKSFALIYSS